MTPKVDNLQFASLVRNRLARAGVAKYIIAAGARNAPLVKVIAGEPTLRHYQFFDERGAAFFALGRARATKRPVAVVTTSGTAVAELLPAAVEAHYTGVPLVLLTADRPKSFRGSASPQTIEQPGIFGPYATAFDIDLPEELADVRIESRRPTHINVCFDEPLLKGTIAAMETVVDPVLEKESVICPESDFFRSIEEMKNPLVVISGVDKWNVSGTKELALKLNFPCYLESTSQLREDSELESLRLRSGESGLRQLVEKHAVDGLIRIGGVPTFRLWRDIEEKRHLKVVSVSDLPFSGLSWEKSRPVPVAEATKSVLQKKRSDKADAILDADRAMAAKLDSLLKHHGHSEPALFAHLSKVIPQGSNIFLGNSLSIREWDLAATFENRDLTFHANRGANGIDGLVATFLGLAGAEKENWLILGDLSALYDLNALALVNINPTAFANKRLRIAVINNGGGKIFARMFGDPVFENRHSIDFSAWAKMFGWEYDVQTAAKASLIPRNSDRAIIEFQVDDEVSRKFWSEYEREMC